VATTSETPAIPIPAHQAIAAPDFSYFKNDNVAVQQPVVNLPAAPANAQIVQPEQVGTATTVTPQQAAIVNDLLRNNNEQTTGNIAGNDLTVLSVKANPVVTTTIAETVKGTDPLSKKEGVKSSELDNSTPLPAENNLETVVTPVAAKEAVKPGKEELKETFSQTNQPESSAALTDSDVTADYAKVETGVNRQVIVGEHVPIANFARTVEGSSPTASQLTAGVPEDPHNVAGQIVEQARMINRVNNSEMIVKLKPEHLGELTLKVTVENGAVSASFHSNNSEVRTIIEASLTQLKQELSTQGLKVENVGVYAGLNQSFSNEQQQQAAQQQQIKFKNRRQEESFINAIEAAAVLPTTSDAGVDYRI
jgi:flagellar hook-length control protein FliK